MKRLVLAAAALLASASGTAHAVPIAYELSSVNVAVNTTEPGLVIQTALAPLPGAFVLDDGEDFTFELFRIWTDETSVNADDRVAKPISASLTFAQPGSGDAVVGVTEGRATFALLDRGVVTWDGPTIVVTPTATYSITLNDAVFNAGIFDLNPGRANGATISATITQLQSVPEPGTALLTVLGGGAIGLVALKRRRAARAA